jgi:DNA-binding NarL/FixJ family response regulator
VRIFVVEDHAIARRGIVSLLEEQLWTVCGEAGDGVAALAGIGHHRPDVVVLDYGIPPPTGLDIIRQIAQTVPSCQVLVFTMHDEDELIQDLLIAGVRAVVLKSDPDTELIAAIRSLSHHRPYLSRSLPETLLEYGRSQVGDTLTRRELQVIQMIALGHTNKAIAKALDVSVKTVESHRMTAMSKTRAHSTADLTRYAVRHKLVEP